jgi:hypothetical protein
MPLVLAGTTSGATTIQATDGATQTITLPNNTGTVVTDTATQTLTNKTLTSPAIDGTPTGVGVLTSGTSVASTSGTSIDFTSIPSWVKRITVILAGVSTSGTSVMQIQLGDSGGIENTGYSGGARGFGQTASSSGAVLSFDNAASIIWGGAITINFLTGTTWAFSGNIYGNSDGYNGSMACTKTLSATLDRVRITTVNGTDTFDAGSINILFE